MSYVDPTNDNPRPSSPADTPKDDPADDGDEYELEDLDPTLARPSEEFAREDIEAAAEAIDINEFYNDYNRGIEFGKVFDQFKVQFQIRHLMLLTAGVAVMMALWKLVDFGGVLLIVLVLLAGALFFIAQQEKKQQAEALARRNRKAAAARRRAAGGTMYDEPLEEEEEEPETGFTLPEFKIAFSMKQVMIAMTVACVVMGVGSLLPATGLLSLSTITALIGALGVIGIVVHLVGGNAPDAVVLSWWFIMAAYVALNFVTYLATGGQ